MIPDQVFASTLDEMLTPLADYLTDPEITEIVINGPDNVFVERSGRMHRTSVCFDGEAALLAIVRVLAQYVGRPFDQEHPILEGRMPDGSRIQALAGALCRDGTHLAIRRFRNIELSLAAMLTEGCMSEPVAAQLRQCMEQRRNMLIVGGTGSGKTSLLNALMDLIPQHERVLVLEDARELAPRNAHLVQLETRPADANGRGAVSMRALFKASLRMRPDRIVIGEIRDGTALDLIQAMTSGHAGSLGTLHASHPRAALLRLEMLAMMADVELPLHALRSQLASAVEVVVQLTRQRDGKRVLTHLAELSGLDERGQYVLRDMLARSTDAVTSADSQLPEVRHAY